VVHAVVVYVAGFDQGRETLVAGHAAEKVQHLKLK
jgi:hypothetical protein